ncbi:MAG: hypothetical protein H8D22_05240 [Candidatus Cloacimonetes bacterium]|nr:hypothetical protein [Candidatus Cloacimonadota bacterium]
MQEKEINLIDYWNIIWKRKKFIIISVLIVTILAVIISLLLPKWYKATAVIMPPATEEGKFSSMLGSNLGAFGLGGMFGGSESQMRLLAILKSRNMLEALDDKFDFQKKYEAKFKFQTYNNIKSNLRIEVGEEDQIKISFLDKDQDLVAGVVNYIVHCLDSLNIALSTTKAKSNREFIENRMMMVQDSLAFFESKISNFMEKNRIISIDEQLKAEVEKAADMKAQIMAKEIELDVMKTRLTPNNQKIADSEIALKILKDKYDEFFDHSVSDKLFISLENIPSIQKQFAQLKRKEVYFTKLLEYLGPQFEQAKIDEAKDVPTVQVLDKAVRPEWKSKPKRIIIVFGSLIFSILLATMIVLIKNRS